MMILSQLEQLPTSDLLTYCEHNIEEFVTSNTELALIERVKRILEDESQREQFVDESLGQFNADFHIALNAKLTKSEFEEWVREQIAELDKFRTEYKTFFEQ